MENTQILQLLNRQSLSSRLVFIDPTVEDYQSLVAGVLPDTEVFILNTQRDGVEQISELLATKSEITSLHIVSHGAPGQIYLGNTQLGQQTLNHYAGQLINWAEALSTDAQILLYGCDVAQTQLGRAFVQQLSELTGAVVFASDDKTGSAAKGGNWKLEVRTASTTAAVAFTPATLAAYAAVLAEPYLVKDIFPGSDGSGLYGLKNVNGVLYFTAEDGIHGIGEGGGGELWKSDGSATGTVLVKDVYRGSDDEEFGLFGGFSDLININDTLYFAADDGTLPSGRAYGKLKLWKSDGTNAGTVLVKGINYRKDDMYDTYSIYSLTNVNGVLYFGLSKYDKFRDVSLWKTDGTESGTVLVKELYPERTNFNITSSININGTLYFIVSTYNDYESDIIANELWKSDGTTDGTVLIKDIKFGGFEDYYIRSPQLFNFNNTLYFFSRYNGRIGLWKSDGTEQSTVLLKDILPEEPSDNPNYTNNTDYAIVNGILYFSAEELWKSDGTVQGTTLVKDINPGSSPSSPSNLINFNGVLYFSANDGIHGTELWKTDGTTEGTVLVKDINPGSGGSGISELINVNGELYFSANEGIHGKELWKSDGTTEGTVLVKDIYPGVTKYSDGDSPNSSNPLNLTSIGGILYFTADDGIHGRELWALDTNPTITSPIISINTINSNASEVDNQSAIFRISRIGDTNNALDVKYTIAGTATNGIDYNQLTGTVTIAAGQSFVYIAIAPINDIFSEGSETVTLTLFKQQTYAVDTSNIAAATIVADDTNNAVVNQPYLVKYITPTLVIRSLQSTYGNFTNVDGILYFNTNDNFGNIDYEWKSDGTKEGTVLLKGIFPSASNLISINGTIYVIADGKLWKSDGTEDGTVQLKNISASNLINVNGTLYFTTYDDKLWTSDGTTQGTVQLKNISTSNLTNFNGTLYFTTYDSSINSIRLWKTNGTIEGTVSVKSITQLNNLTIVNSNGSLYFSGVDSSNQSYQLWKSDGTTQGTNLVKNIDVVNNYYSISSSLNVNGILYFIGRKDGNVSQLWKSDGTTQGTVLLKDINFGSDGQGFSDDLLNVNGTLYFTADDGIHGEELWKSDGTIVGTVLVKDILPGNGDSIFYYNSSLSTISTLTNINGTLYFIADDGIHGKELWKSDGTTEGTILVKDINLGAGSSNPNYLTNVNGTLYFSAYDETHGTELWRSDGTTEGTILVADIKSGAGGSRPYNLTNIDGTLFFTANNGINDYQLWALNTNLAQFIPVVSITAADANAAEDGDDSASFRISRTGQVDTALAVKYTIAGTATNGSDYTQLTGIASIAVGQSFVDITINPINDGLAEISETVTFTLSEQGDYDINTSSSAASVTIFDKFNIINGNGSRDPLIGTAGNDRITGGTGSKTITGGAGNDEFVYTNIREVGQRIADFTVGSDQIVLTSLLDSLANDVYYNGYNGSDAIADGFVRLVQGSNSNSTIVQIDRDGPVGNGYYGSNAIFRNFIELDNVTPQALNNSNSFVF